METIKTSRSVDNTSNNDDKILLDAIASSLQGIPSFISSEEAKTPD